MLINYAFGSWISQVHGRLPLVFFVRWGIEKNDIASGPPSYAILLI